MCNVRIVRILGLKPLAHPKKTNNHNARPARKLPLYLHLLKTTSRPPHVPPAIVRLLTPMSPISCARRLHAKPPSAARNAAATAAAATGAVAASAATKSEPRRPKLPEIDDIDSGLAKDAETAHAERALEDDDVAGKKSFRRGFFVVLVVIAILAALYAQAPRIKAAVPALGPTLDSYVATVDRGRVWLDETVRGALLSMSGDS